MRLCQKSNRTLLLTVTSAKIFRHCQRSPGKQNYLAESCCSTVKFLYDTTYWTALASPRVLKRLFLAFNLLRNPKTLAPCLPFFYFQSIFTGKLEYYFTARLTACIQNCGSLCLALSKSVYFSDVKLLHLGNHN